MKEATNKFNDYMKYSAALQTFIDTPVNELDYKMVADAADEFFADRSRFPGGMKELDPDLDFDKAAFYKKYRPLVDKCKEILKSEAFDASGYGLKDFAKIKIKELAKDVDWNFPYGWKAPDWVYTDEERIQTFGKVLGENMNIKHDTYIPAPFNKYYEIGMLNDGSIPEEEIPDAFDNYGGMTLLAIVYAKEQYEDALGYNCLDYCYLVEDGNKFALVTTAGQRVYYVDIAEVERCVNKDVDEDFDVREPSSVEYGAAMSRYFRMLTDTLEKYGIRKIERKRSVEYDGVVNGYKFFFVEADTGTGHYAKELYINDREVNLYRSKDSERSFSNLNEMNYFDILSLVKMLETDNLDGIVYKDELEESLTESTEMTDAQKYALQELDTCLYHREIDSKQHELAQNIQWDINFEDVLLFINGIDIPLQDIKHVEYGDCSNEYDGCYNVTLRNGTTKQYGWHDWDATASLTCIDCNESLRKAELNLEENAGKKFNKGDRVYVAVSNRQGTVTKMISDDVVEVEFEANGTYPARIDRFYADEVELIDMTPDLDADVNEQYWAVYATDKETGKEYCAGVYEDRYWASYWSGMDRAADREYGYGNFDYRVEQVNEYTPEMDKSRSELSKLKLARYDSRKNESVKRSDAGKKLKESTRGFYVTTYWPDEKWSPEEGGSLDTGWDAVKSKFFRTEEEARRYLDSRLEGMNIVVEYDGAYEYQDTDGELYMVALEPFGKRGKWHAPARSWAEIEFDDPVERPYFDRKGDRVARNPRLVAKERKEKQALEKEFRSAIEGVTTKEEMIDLLSDFKYHSLISKFGHEIQNKLQELV